MGCGGPAGCVDPARCTNKRKAGGRLASRPAGVACGERVVCGWRALGGQVEGGGRRRRRQFASRGE